MIEDDALKTMNMLKELQTQVIQHPVFGRYYSNLDRLQIELSSLIADLAANYEKFRDARLQISRNPGNLVYQSFLDLARQGLAKTAIDAENFWQKYRGELLQTTATLLQTAKETSEAHDDDDFDKVLDGFTQFSQFLSNASTIATLLVQWSPAIITGVNYALTALQKFLGF